MPPEITWFDIFVPLARLEDRGKEETLRGTQRQREKFLLKLDRDEVSKTADGKSVFISPSLAQCRERNLARNTDEPTIQGPGKSALVSHGCDSRGPFRSDWDQVWVTQLQDKLVSNLQ